jgi:hypothetical protein
MMMDFELTTHSHVHAIVVLTLPLSSAISRRELELGRSFLETRSRHTLKLSRVTETSALSSQTSGPVSTKHPR